MTEARVDRLSPEPASERSAPGREGRYALVGTGHRAEMFFDALVGEHREVGRPVALCDPNTTRMDYYRRRWRHARPAEPDLATYRPEEFGRMIEEQRPDAIIVTSVDATHGRYVVDGLLSGCDVIVEKPLATDADTCRQIVEAAHKSDRHLTVTFNYRYAPRNAKVKELISEGAIGKVTSVHFEWLLDTVHGADYFRRWHRDKRMSGGLGVHKSTHHFDLVNWWIDGLPETVFAFGMLRFYGRDNAEARGLRPGGERSREDPHAAADLFSIDLGADQRLRQLYLDAEHEDGYWRDRNVFGEGITIEDNLAVVVRYRDGALLTYSLNAHSPWEGYRVGINGTGGRIELTVCERAEVRPGEVGGTVGRAGRGAQVIDPSATGQDATGSVGVRQEGTLLVLQHHWEEARPVEVSVEPGAHGGGDARLLHDVFRGDRLDVLGQRAGYLDGVQSVLVGVAANHSMERGLPVRLDEFGIPLSEATE